MNMLDESTLNNLKDEELLLLSQSEPDVFALLIDRYEMQFLRKAVSVLRNSDDAIDAVQDAFVKIYVAAKRFKRQEGASFSSWAYKILINHCFTLYQKNKKRRANTMLISEEMESVLRDHKGEEEIEKHYVMEEFLVRLSKLPIKFRNVLERHFLFGISHKEIAKKEGISEGAVRVRIHRAKTMLRSVIASEGNLE